jgi:hypothetical protein
MWAIVIPDVSDCGPFVRTLMNAGVKVLRVITPKWKDVEPSTESVTVEDIRDRYSTADSVVRRLNELGIRRDVIIGVYAFSESGVDAQGHLRECLGQFGGSCERFRNKLVMRELASLDDPIRSPLYYFISPDVGIPPEHFISVLQSRQLAQLGRPLALLKPLANSASRGIVKIQHAAELEGKIKDARKNMNAMLIEEYINGDLYHVGGLMWDGECLMEVVARHAYPLLDLSLGVTEHAMLLTLDHDSEPAQELLGLSAQIRARFGMTEGLFEVEFLRCAVTGEFYFLEIAARPVGSRILLLQEFLYGEDPYIIFARLIINKYCSGEVKVLERKRGMYVGMVLFKGRKGMVESLRAIDQSLGPGIDRSEQYARSGTIFQNRSSANFGYVVTTAPDETEARRRLIEYQKNFAYEINE